MAPDQTQSHRHRRNFNDPGHAHELTFSCYSRYPFLGKDRVCHWLCDSIEDARNELKLDVWAWVFMPDHVHLIIRPRNEIYDMAVIRRRIKEPVAKQALTWLRENAPEWLPKLERQRGRRKEYLFWQSGGGYDRNIIEPKTLLNMIEYIHLNPVRKHLVESVDDWKWSSASWFMNVQVPPLVPDPIPVEWTTVT